MRFKTNNIRRWWLFAAIALPALLATGQPSTDTIPAPQNQFSVDVQILARGETRYGGLPEAPIEVDDQGFEIVSDKVPKSNFVLGRTRLPINFKRDWLELRVTPQHSGVWGQAGKGAFNLYETWVKMTAHNGLFAQVGRVALNYDDERIIGSDDWAMASSSHDILRLGYEGHGHKVHAILAYNQNANVMSAGGSYYADGAQVYKTMQDLWYHYDFSRIPLGASLLFMNVGMQSEQEENLNKTWFQHLLGCYFRFHPKNWDVEASYYRQFGKNEKTMKINAWMMSSKVSFIPAPNYGFNVGYDYLSGDEYFAVPAEGQIGMAQHKVLKGFNTVYGSHHKFYGAMDFFYVSTYFNGFTPGLQNAYVGCFWAPLKALRLNTSYHYFALATTLHNLDKTLGHEWEFQANYTINRDVMLSGGVSLMWGGGTMERLKRSSNKDQLRWGWISLIVNPRIFTAKW